MLRVKTSLPRGWTRSGSTVVTDRLDSWKEISAYMGRHVRTVIRWEKQKGLPVHRVPGGERQSVYAYAHELDEWLRSQGSEIDSSPDAESKEPGTEISASAPDSNAAMAAVQELDPGSGSDSVRRSGRIIWVAWFLAGAAVAVIAAFSVHLLAAPRGVSFTGITQITSDGTSKSGLVTYGRHIYFGEFHNGRTVLSEVSVNGGPISTISTPFNNAYPVSISPDGSRLLVLDQEGQEQELALWIVPVTGGRPIRVGNVRCHSAAWSPDGREIAFARGNSIYLTSDRGATIRRLETFTTVPDLLRWTPDGKRIRLELRDWRAWRSSFWEVVFAHRDSADVAALVPLHITLPECCDTASQPNAADQSFVGGWNLGLGRLLLIGAHRSLLSKRFFSRSLNGEAGYVSDLALDPQGNVLYEIADSASTQGFLQADEIDLLWFDRRSREFRPFLPGISANDVDFSPNGRWIAYVRLPDTTLWVSHPDGTDAHQIVFPESNIELPRWSPDGRQIAFTAELPGKPWRIFVVPARDGKAREASRGTDNQGAPTWSPDGKWLVYGNVWCQETDSCEIHKIDLATGQEFTVPGSKGLWTARWSPDGRYVAALQPVRHQLWLLDLRRGQWRKLADGINGNDLSWSADSRHVFASIPNGDKPKIVRVSLGGQVKTAVDLSSFSKMPGRIDTWFALAPGGSIIFLHWFEPNEIYALHVSTN